MAAASPSAASMGSAMVGRCVESSLSASVHDEVDSASARALGFESIAPAPTGAGEWSGLAGSAEAPSVGPSLAFSFGGFDGVLVFGFDGVLVDERRCNETNRQSRAVKHDAILNSIDSIRADLQCSTDFRTSAKFDAETFELVICELAEGIHGGYVFIEKNGKEGTQEGTQPENDEKRVQVPGHHRLRVGKIELAVLNWSALKLGGEFISLPRNSSLIPTSESPPAEGGARRMP